MRRGLAVRRVVERRAELAERCAPVELAERRRVELADERRAAASAFATEP